MKKSTLLETATKNGWEAQWRPEGSVRYRISGTTQDGIKWQMESVGERGYTKWTTNSVHLEEFQCIVLSQNKPRSPYSLTNLIFGFFMRRKMQKVIDEVLKDGTSEDDKPAVMYDLALQSLALKDNHYKLFVSELDERFARRVFDGEIEQTIMNWFTGPGQSRFIEGTLSHVSIDEDCVSIDAQSNLVEAPAIEQFIELGLIVTRKARKIKGA